MKGLDLGRAFYHRQVAALVTVPHAAAFLGSGSDVLGYDDEISTDHDWGPRLTVFVEEGAVQTVRETLSALPATFEGYPVWYGRAADGVAVDVTNPDAGEERFPLVKVDTVAGYIQKHLGNIETDLDWLVLPDQRLLEWTSGEVFHDDIGLAAIREKYAWMPENVWIYRLASAWAAISEEAAFVGRAGDVGDDVGSRLIAARLMKRAMGLAFLMEKRYAPYMKWFGTAFSRLECGAELGTAIERVLACSEWHARVKAIGIVWDLLIEIHNERVGPRVEMRGAPYRPQYWSHDFSNVVEALETRIEEPLKRMPLLGGVSEWLDNTPILDNAQKIKSDLGVILDL